MKTAFIYFTCKKNFHFNFNKTLTLSWTRYQHCLNLINPYLPTGENDHGGDHKCLLRHFFFKISVIITWIYV